MVDEEFENLEKGDTAWNTVPKTTTVKAKDLLHWIEKSRKEKCLRSMRVNCLSFSTWDLQDFKLFPKRLIFSTNQIDEKMCW